VIMLVDLDGMEVRPKASVNDISQV